MTRNQIIPGILEDCPCCGSNGRIWVALTGIARYRGICDECEYLTASCSTVEKVRQAWKEENL